MQVCLYLVQRVLISPTFPQVSGQCSFTLSDVYTQRHDYAACGTQELSMCTSDFSTHLGIEEARVQAVVSDNQASLAAAQLASSACVATVTTARNALLQWEQVLPITYRSSCSSQDVVSSSTYIHNNAVTDTALGASAEMHAYSASTSSMLSQLSTHLAAVQTQYQQQSAADRASLLASAQSLISSAQSSSQQAVTSAGQQTQAAWNNLLACVGGATAGASCSSGTALLDTYTKLKAITDAEVFQVQVRQKEFNGYVAQFAADGLFPSPHLTAPT